VAAAFQDAECGGTLEGPVVLRDIEQLPKSTLAPLLRCHGWAFDREGPGQPLYLMNHCQRCLAQVTDRYLHTEPGSAFFPCTPDDCWNISLYEVPAAGPVPAVCSYTLGGMTEWLDYSEAKPLMEL
jgi:hypothetical protein